MAQNPADSHIDQKITNALERIAHAFRVMLNGVSRELGLSPIQLQMLQFLADHSQMVNTVSQLALEFDLTKPTVSDSIKVLEKKNLVRRMPDSVDGRSHTLGLTPEGLALVDQSNGAFRVIRETVAGMEDGKVVLYSTLLDIIRQLQVSGTLSVQRTCYLCRFYESKGGQNHFCHLLNEPLALSDIRLDCPEFEGKI